MDLESEVASEDAFVAQVAVQLRRVDSDHLWADVGGGVQRSGVRGFRRDHGTLFNIHGETCLTFPHEC